MLVGYSHVHRTMDLVNYNLVSGIVDRRLSEVVQLAFDTALALVRGETVPTLVESPTPLNSATGKEKEGVYPSYLMMPDMARGLEDSSSRSFPVKETEVDP